MDRRAFSPAGASLGHQGYLQLHFQSPSWALVLAQVLPVLTWLWQPKQLQGLQELWWL
ncbi:hypothetical protein ACRRTK_001723 [Alexandromys fortis]